jgi:putative transposase
MPSTHTNLHYHIIFSTKDRLPLITDDLRSELHSYLGGIIKNQGGTPLAIGGTADHVHLLAGLKPTLRLSDVIREIKSSSSEWINKQRRKKFTWQKGYGAFTVSPSGIENVRNYVLNQMEHHRRKTFQQEYIEILELSKTEYDERFLW